MLAFIARLGVVPRDAVALWAGTGRTVTHERERRLRETGLLTVLPRFGTDGPILIATRQGLRACGRSELRPAAFSPARVRHESVVARLAASIESSGHPVLSEREIMARERVQGASMLSASLPGGRTHRCDFMRVAPAVEAIEVELTPKGAARLDAILRAWRRAAAEDRIGSVLYRCAPPALPAVERAMARTKTAGVIRVEPLALPVPVRA